MLWKFVKGASIDKSEKCFLYHYYDSKKIHARSISFNGIDSIWRHYLKWDHEKSILIYYDGRDDDYKAFEDQIITLKDYTFDKQTNKIYINIKPREKLEWKWCYDLNKDYVEIRDYEKKKCPFCDKQVKIHYNGGFDQRYIKEEHLDHCKLKKTFSKKGLQNKIYYAFHDLEKASITKPYDFRQINKNKWELISTGDGMKLSTQKLSKTEITLEKEIIKTAINILSIDNIDLFYSKIDKIKNEESLVYLTENLYSSYKPIKEYPHHIIIKKLNITKEVLELFQKQFIQPYSDKNFIKELKHKMCLIAILYKEKLIKKEDILEIFSKINNPDQVEVAIYFFLWDSKTGLYTGMVHDCLIGFESVIKIFHLHYDNCNMKTQFAIDDIVDFISK